MILDGPIMPVIWLGEAESMRQALAIVRTVNREGYAARKAGVQNCPLFVDPDMAIYWWVGWREADKELQRRESGV